MKTINIGKNRELFWSNYLVDEEKTSAFPRMIQPTLKGSCFSFDKGMELEAISYPCIVKDDKGYKLYYIVWSDKSEFMYMAVIESTDGIEWKRPALNIYDHPELDVNNVVLDNSDTLFVFYDTNPACDPSEKYKAVGPYVYKDEENVRHVELWCYTSPDGYHFERKYFITDDGHFDSLNTMHWANGRYVCYYRHFHTANGEDSKGWNNENIRDIRVIYSEDFKTWTKQKLIEFDDGKDYPLYTNNIIPYERAPQCLIGFPVRYCERKEWSSNIDQMASGALKKKRFEVAQREGLTVTDCVFITSHDGEMWHRYNEAFMTPGYEHENNWVYGDCYSAYGIVDSGKENYYMYTKDWHRSIGCPKPLNRYEIRKDGFACFMADGEERILVTKPIVFDGKDLHINFETSAYGYIYIDVLDAEGNNLSGKESFEIYGNTIDRKVLFADGTDFSEYAGKPVRLRFRMMDAKLFSMKFE